MRRSSLSALLLALCLAVGAARSQSAQTHVQPTNQRTATDPSALPDSVEFTIDSTVVPVAALQEETSPAIACTDSQCFVVWRDTRYHERIFGARIVPAFRVSDSVGLLFPMNGYFAVTPSVAAGPGQCLAAWTKTGGGLGDMRAARVSVTGGLLDTSELILGDRVASEPAPIIYNGSEYFVVWSGNLGRAHGLDIIGGRVTPAGAVLDPLGLPIDTSDGDQHEPALAFGGSMSLVTWTADGNIHGQLVTREGTRWGQRVRISRDTASELHPAVAYDGTLYLVAWAIERSGQTDIQAVRVTPTGVVIDTIPFVVSNAVGNQNGPAACYDGWNFAVVWEDYRSGGNPGIRLARVARTGDVLDPSGIEVTTDTAAHFWPTVASAGQGSVVAWHQGVSDAFDVYGARVSQAGIVETTGVLVSKAAQPQIRPAVSRSADGYLVTWSDYRNEGMSATDIYATRLDRDGHLLETRGHPVITAAGNQDWSDIASNGTDYLVTWQDVRSGTFNVYCARVSSTGVVLDSGGFRLSSAASHCHHPALTFDGGSYMAVWDDARNGNDDIYGARLTRDGVLLDTAGICIHADSGNQRYPAVSSNGTDWLVVWRDGGSGRFDIHGSRVSQAGVVLDTILITAAGNDQQYPSVASDGTNWLVAWEDQRGWRAIHGVLVDSSGAVVNSFEVSYTGRYQHAPAVAYDGADYQVIWDGAGLEGATIDPDGRVLRQYILSDYRSITHGSAIATGAEGRFVALYSGYTDFDGTTPYHAERLWCVLGALPGIAEGLQRTTIGDGLGTTIVRSMFFLPHALACPLLDISGRTVMALAPGPNDVRHLAPGVYFIRMASGAERDAPSVTKVVVTR